MISKKIISYDEKTIVAHATPKGSGAIAIIRISGDTAFDIVNLIAKLPSGNRIIELSSHTVNYGFVVDFNGDIIDQVMFIVMRAPKTFTGQDLIEINCHNNPFIIEKIISLLIQNGARLASPGEFAKRAFLNGKIDLSQAEAIQELVYSNTQYSLKKSLSKLRGSLSNFIYTIEDRLVKCLALSNASFEFIDEEIDFIPEIKKEFQEIYIEIDKLMNNSVQQQHIKEGIRVALIGSVNAGKSSLFNILLGKNRSIVTNIAGTTRDCIEAGIYQDDYYITLIDTAGLRETDNLIEQEGIKKSFSEAHACDIILLVIDSSRLMSSQEYEIYLNLINSYSSKIICVLNKSDLEIKLQDNYLNYFFNNLNSILYISTQINYNIDLLHTEIKDKINKLIGCQNSPYILNQRQFNLISSLKSELSEILKILGSSIDNEILSIHINETIQIISEFSGKSISESAMDTIFKEFCVGK